VTLNAGTLQFVANSGAGVAPISSSEKIGPLTLGPAIPTINTGYNAAPVFGSSSTLTASSLTHQAAASGSTSSATPRR